MRRGFRRGPGDVARGYVSCVRASRYDYSREGTVCIAVVTMMAVGVNRAQRTGRQQVAPYMIRGCLRGTAGWLGRGAALLEHDAMRSAESIHVSTPEEVLVVGEQARGKRKALRECDEERVERLKR